MKMSLYAVELVILISQIVFVAAASGESLPLWKTQLMHYAKWKGHYTYQDIAHSCSVAVHSVQKDDDGGALVSFSADNTTLDMNAFSQDGISITFKTDTIYQPGNHFYDGFQFVVELIQHGNLHVFLGNITHPTSNFSTIELVPEASGESLPLWKTQLMHYAKWKGHYTYQDIAHSCSVAVHSVQKDDDGGALVSFSADNTTLDMNAFSQDGISITFKTDTIYQPGNHFYDGFQFVVELIQHGNLHVFLGNITHPTSNFSTIELVPEGSWMRNYMKSSDLSIGLAVGISLFLFVVCVVIGIVILRWAIRKGYLRHVAMSYKNFRNPDSVAEPPVSFNNTQQESQPEEVNVHI